MEGHFGPFYWLQDWLQVIGNVMVRLAGFEPATFGSGDRRSSPTELQAHAHVLKILDLARKSKP